MNLRTNPTRSQRVAHWEALAEAVVGAAVAPKASKKSKRGGGNRGRTASQKTRPPPPPPPQSSPLSPNQGGKGRTAEVVEGDERARGDSTTQSPTPAPNIPPPSAQPQTNAFNEELARDEEELNEIAGPAGPQSDNEVAGSIGPQSENESDNLNRTQVSQSAPSKVARGKRRARTPEDIDAWQQVRVQVQTLVGTKILTSFGVHLEVFREEAGYVEISDRIIAKLERLEADQSTDEVRVSYTHVGDPVARVNVHGMKEIVLTIETLADDFRELIEIVKSLFQKGKTTNLSVVFQCEFKQIREVIAVGGEEPVTQQPATQQPLNQSAGGRKRKATGTREAPAARHARQVIQEEQIEVATDNHILALTTRLLCKDKTCSNYGFNCYPFGKMGHVSLDNQELRMWNELFRTRKDTTVKYCPPEVLSSAITRRQKAEGRRVQRGDNSPKKEQLFGGINLTINTGEFGAKSSLGVAQQLRSSPPTFEGSETENLKDYVIWLAEKGHVSFEHGRVAREALAREGWGFESLPTIEWEGRGGWIAMAIPPGVIRELLKKQKPWRDVARRLMIEEEMRRQRGDNTPSVVELGSD